MGQSFQESAFLMPSVFSGRPRIEEVAPEVFRIDMCVPEALGATNSYLFRADGVDDSGRSLIVDVGTSQPETKRLFDCSLSDLGVAWEDVDVFITHFHWDHCAGLSRISRQGMTVYGGLDSFADRRVPIMGGRAIAKIERQVSAAHGIVDDFDERYWEPMRDKGWGDVPLTRLHEGDELVVGRYRLEVLETPGHDMNHLCLIDRRTGLFVGGDQVMQDFYPSVLLESDVDQVAYYFETMERLSRLKSDLVLCGHGRECTDLSARCAQIVSHLERQLDDFLELCGNGCTDPGELAYLSTHRPRRTPWEERSVFGRCALLGQTMAFLKHFVVTGDLPDVYELTLLK